MRRFSWRAVLATLGRHGAEQTMLGAAVAVAGLAVLGKVVRDAQPVVFVVALGLVALVGALLVGLVERLRRRTGGAGRIALNAAVALALVGLTWRFPPDRTLRAITDLLAQERATQVRVVAHQVYAAYRRMDLDGQRRILERSETYDNVIRQAAQQFGISPELMVGIASTESSFHPRPSHDGGDGLFQITAIPAAAEQAAKRALGVERLDSVNHKHNAYLAGATLALYARQMKGDLLLTLLAYNIGPHNGGLAFVMKQYGAHNFAQVQPYLQDHPRGYPVRVLSAALAYRVWRHFSRLPRIEEPGWAEQIQALGIPGLEDGPSLATALEVAKEPGPR